MREKRNSDNFVHVLLFECVQCGCPVPLAVTSDAKNIEDVDVRRLELECRNCKWSGRLDGFAARRHWVDDWKTVANEQKSGRRGGNNNPG